MPISPSLPSVGGDGDVWGTKNNAALTTIINRVNTHADQHEPGGADDLSGSFTPWVKGARTFVPDDFGADPTGVADSQSAFASILSAMKSGDRIYLPAGSTYAHSAVLDVGVAGITIFGRGTLKATTQTASALRMQADDQHLVGIQTSCTTTGRGSTFDETAIVLEAAGQTVRDVIVNGSRTVGVAALGASYFHIEKCIVQTSQADAFHNTDAAHDGVWVDCTAINPGDDGFSVVSYDTDSDLVKKIDCSGFRLYGQTNGRGMTVAGGQGIVFRAFKVYQSYGAGIYVFIGNSFATRSISDVRIFGGEIIQPNTAGWATLPHGAILVANNWTTDSTKSVSDVHVYDVEVRDAGLSVGTGTGTTSVNLQHTGSGTMSGNDVNRVRLLGTQTLRAINNSAGTSAITCQGIDMGRIATASAPTAANAGDGAQYYDTTLGVNVFSTGTSWSAGAAGSVIGSTARAFKTANGSNVNTVGSYTTDTDLSLAVTSGQTYSARMVLMFSASDVTSDINVLPQLTSGVGTSGTWSLTSAIVATGTSAAAFMEANAAGFATALTAGTFSGTSVVVAEFFFTAPATGTFGIQYAVNTAGGAGITLIKGSRMEMMRLA
jgi:hypothetical protein